MTLPDFYILGGQKCGTHWIAANLAQRAGIYIPSKELHFFDNLENFNKGIGWYSSHFAQAGDNRLIGERTPNYLSVPGVPERIRGATPDARMIVTLRDPVDRALSALSHSIVMGRYPPWVNLDRVVAECLEPGNDPYGIVSYGTYNHHIQNYYKVFPPEQFCFVVFEQDILARPEATLARVLGFLGFAQKDGQPELVNERNSGVKTRLGAYLSTVRPFNKRVGVHLALKLESVIKRPRLAIAEATRARLRDRYSKDVEDLQRTIGRDLGGWLR